jgi:hypothetical protein
VVGACACCSPAGVPGGCSRPFGASGCACLCSGRRPERATVDQALLQPTVCVTLQTPAAPAAAPVAVSSGQASHAPAATSSAPSSGVEPAVAEPAVQSRATVDAYRCGDYVPIWQVQGGGQRGGIAWTDFRGGFQIMLGQNQSRNHGPSKHRPGSDAVYEFNAQGDQQDEVDAAMPRAPRRVARDPGAHA